MISIKDVEHVARLARLSLSAQEKEIFTQQLGRIIEHFNELQNVDTTGVEPLAHALPIVNVTRDDIVVAPLGANMLLSSAPDVENGYFRVPRIGE